MFADVLKLSAVRIIGYVCHDDLCQKVVRLRPETDLEIADNPCYNFS
jgi:hypothetical protein